MNRANARMARSRPTFDRLTIIVLVAFLVVASVTAVLAFTWARSFFASWNMTQLPGMPVSSQGSVTEPGGKPNPSGAGGVGMNTPLQPPDSGPTPVPWDGSSRVTILVMGLDYRDWEEGNDVPRTDTMILFSIDPLSNTAGMLSVPRDLWVSIPGMENNNKINTAYRWGEVYKLPGLGPGLAMKTVEGVLGVPIQYYALLDFNSFVQFIDTMGGLDMHILEEIIVDPIGPNNTVTLYPGVQTLDGATALAYARNRKDGEGDFSRSNRQQEVVMAVRKQVLQFNMLPMLVTKSPELYAELSSGIRTNLTLDQVIKLAWLAFNVPEDNIKKGVFDPHKHVNYASVMTNEGEQAVLIPLPDQIRLLRDEVFATGGPVSPASLTGNLADLMKAEEARLLIRNGTATAGLASRTSELLREEGFNIAGEDNADQAYGVTTIKDYTGNPYTVKYLMEKMQLPDSRVINSFDPNATVDVEIILGNDWVGNIQ
jgi:polyisoprenyl-teichoic acid--peptidoglycan teichoic acid transferase